jgi:hypothetical protein
VRKGPTGPVLLLLYGTSAQGSGDWSEDGFMPQRAAS